MKSSIHPQWNHQATVKCGCGATFITGSTRDQITVDVCSACHPFYTGEMKFVDAQGRVERFMQKRTASANYVKPSKQKKQNKPEALSLRDMLAKSTGKVTKAE